MTRDPLVIRSRVDETHLSYEAALASAAARKVREAGRPCRPVLVASPAHVRAAQTRKADQRAKVMQRVEELRGG